MSEFDRSKKTPLVDANIKSTREISRRSLLTSTGVVIAASITPMGTSGGELKFAQNTRAPALKDTDLESGSREDVALLKDDFNLCSKKDAHVGNQDSYDPGQKDTDHNGDCNNYDSSK